MNHRVWAILRREYLERVRNKWFLFATLIVPVLMLGATFLPVIMAEQGSERPLTVAVVDRTGGDVTARLAEVLAPDEVAVRPFRADGEIETTGDLRA
ncbi:MAG TPA: hypothetical protein ENO23_00245, partial [Alphaproteobacteria bacterium]|nr:hypothetical protein [Alphaproteobacteria bacterium]